MAALKILVVQETDWTESLPLQSHHIMEYLARRGHEVTVVDYQARWKAPVRGQHIRSRVYPAVRRTDSGSPVRLVRPGMAKVPGIARLTSFPGQFSSIFHEMTRCDVVVLYSVPTNGLQTIISARILAKPVLFHSFDILHRMTGHRFLAAPTWTFERFVYKRANKVIVISGALGDYMESLGVLKENILMLPPAVDTNMFNQSIPRGKFRSQLGFTDKDKVALFSGWLYEFCGLDVVMRSMEKLVERVPELKLVVCGEGPLLNLLRQISTELRLKGQVRILGKVPFDWMPMVVASADLCINPYLPDIRSSYAFPSKVAEYMAAGKAVVATDLPGTRSLLPSASGVLLVPPNKLVEALLETILDDDSREEMGEAARKYCESNFSINRVTDRFEESLLQLASSRLAQRVLEN